MLNSVVELPEFVRTAEKLLTEDERVELIDYLAANPMAGVLVRGTGGIRKLRWKRKGMGKRGGSRVVYFFHSDTMPLFLMTLYSKSKMANVSAAERQRLAKLRDILIEKFGDNNE